MPEADMTPEQRAEPRFCVFASPKWGFRATARILISYQDKYAVHTIAKAISRWAPPNENDTASYIGHVCREAGFEPDQELDFHDYEMVSPIVKAIAIHESGGWFFKDMDLEAGLRLAGLEPPRKALAASRTMQASATGGAATAGSAVVEALSQAQDQVSQLTPYLATAKWILIAIIIASIGVTVYSRLDDWKRAAR